MERGEAARKPNLAQAPYRNGSATAWPVPDRTGMDAASMATMHDNPVTVCRFVPGTILHPPGLPADLDSKRRAGHAPAMPPTTSATTSFLQLLRTATAADHQAVDDRFGGFALDDRDDYRRFLQAHARALPAVEQALATGAGEPLPAWRRRTEALANDLAGLDAALPAPLRFTAHGAERWGALYVIEGSRLGGQLLARSVPAGWPAAYLADRHRPGEWRTLLAAIEERAAAADAGWRNAALGGARSAFALYGRAVANLSHDEETRRN